MGANSFGSRFKITSFGESHGAAMGVVIDGCPAGLDFNQELLLKELARRRPGKHGQQQSVVSDREEPDAPEVLSGVYKGKTLGTPIAVIIRNTDHRSKDYGEIAKAPRPGHADDMWALKFGHWDHRGGGRSSGRETVARVVAGAFAQMLLAKVSPATKVIGLSRQIGAINLTDKELFQIENQITQDTSFDSFVAKMPHLEKSKQVEQMLLAAKQDGKSYGGLAEILVLNPPAQIGQPVFHKLKSDLAAAIMSIGATAGVAIGDGFTAADAEGSEFHRRSNTDHYGGIRGGISTGETISLQVVFKPTATVLDTAKKGRHDPCIIPRAIPVIEAMVNLVLADHWLWRQTDKVDV